MAFQRRWRRGGGNSKGDGEGEAREVGGDPGGRMSLKPPTVDDWDPQFTGTLIKRFPRSHGAAGENRRRGIRDGEYNDSLEEVES